MANIGSLSVRLVANATGVKAGVDAAAGYLGRLGGRVQAIFSGGALGVAGRLFAPITSLVSGAVASQTGDLASKFKELAAGIKQTSRDAERFGMPTEDLQGLQYAAERSGIEIEQLNKALFTMQRTRGGDAMENLLTAADQFNAGGINKAAFAFENFGKSGFAMMTLLGRGREGIRAMMEEGAALGHVLSGVDAARVIEANAGLKRISLVVEGIYNKFLVAMAPAISAVSRTLLSFAPALTQMADAGGQAFGDVLEVGVMLLKIITEQVRELGVVFAASFEVFSDTFGVASSKVEGFRDVLKVLAKAFAYVWDTAKAGAGVFYGGLGIIATQVGEIADLMGLEWGKKLKAMGAAMAFTGFKAVQGWGDSAEAVDRMWDNMFKKQDAQQKNLAEGVTAAYHASAAAVQGSKEDVSIRAKFAYQSAMKPEIDLAKQQLEQQKLANQKADNLIDLFRNQFRGGGNNVELKLT